MDGAYSGTTYSDTKRECTALTGAEERAPMMIQLGWCKVVHSLEASYWRPNLHDSPLSGLYQYHGLTEVRRPNRLSIMPTTRSSPCAGKPRCCRVLFKDRDTAFDKCTSYFMPRESMNVFSRNLHFKPHSDRSELC